MSLYDAAARRFASVRSGAGEVLARTGLLAPASLLWQIIRHPRTAVWELAIARDASAFHRRHAFLRSPGRSEAGGKRLLIVALEDGCLKAKIEGILAKAVEADGYTPVILQYSWCRKSPRYYRAFGMTQSVYFDEYLNRVTPDALREIRETVDRVLAEAPTVQTLKRMAFHGVNVGRAALSTVTRSLFKGRVDLSSPAVRETHLRRWLMEAMRRAVAAEAMFTDVQPDLVLVNEKGYVAEAPIFETALNRGINTIYWCHAHRDDAFVLKRYTPSTKHLQAFSLSEDTWAAAQEMPWTDVHEVELREEFRARYEDLSWWLSRRYQAGKVLKPAETVRRQLGLDPSKKTAVIFSHITWDASFFHGEDVFDDFEDWLVETVKAACANPALNWVVKLHPINVYKSRADRAPREPSERVALRTRIGPLPPHIRLLEPDTDLNTFSLFPVTDYCLTVRGTIGIEMACFGIPVLTAGTGRYAGLGFTVDATSRAEYLTRLAQLHTLPRLTPAQVAQAKRYAYVLFCRRPARFTSFRTVFREQLPPGHPFFWDFALALDSRAALAAAPDLAAFAHWATASRAEDFVTGDLGVGTPSEEPVVRAA